MKISQLYVYPIKSIRPTVLESAEATPQGFKYDRRFMLVKTSPSGQRKNMHLSKFPKMCLFSATIIYPAKDILDSGRIVVTYTRPGHTRLATLDVPLEPETAGLKVLEITMHASSTNGYDMGQKYNQWFSQRFGYEVVLLYLGDNRREVLGNMAPAVTMRQQEQESSWMVNLTNKLPFLGGVPGVNEGISFSDVAPYLVISEKSWQNANARLPEDQTLDITKFRPNIVVEGAKEEFDEDFWAELLIGETLKIVLTQNCARCTSINVDFATGKPATSEAGRILQKLQKDRRVDAGSRYSPIFGRYGFLGTEAMAGCKINVGDEVRVLRRNRQRTVFEWPTLST